MVFLRKEVDISGGNNAHQFAAHFACLCDRNTREAMSDFGLKHVSDCVARTHHHWVCDETLLEPLQTKRQQAKHCQSLLIFTLFVQSSKKQSQTKHNPQDKQQIMVNMQTQPNNRQTQTKHTEKSTQMEDNYHGLYKDKMTREVSLVVCMSYGDDGLCFQCVNRLAQKR